MTQQDDTEEKGKPEDAPEHPHGGPPGQTGEHPQGGPPGQPHPEQPLPEPQPPGQQPGPQPPEPTPIEGGIPTQQPAEGEEDDEEAEPKT